MRQTKCVRCKKAMALVYSAYCGRCEEFISEQEINDKDHDSKLCKRCYAVQGFIYIREKRYDINVFWHNPKDDYDINIYYPPTKTKIGKKTNLCNFCNQRSLK